MINKNPLTKIKINKDVALLYGVLLGDGCINRYKYKDRKSKYNYNICITCNALNDKPFFNNVINPLINGLRNKETKWFERKGHKIEFNFCDKKLLNEISSLEFPLGKKKNKIHIPKIFYEKKLVKYIIQGFFATDGSLIITRNPNKYYPRIESHATCGNLLKQIYEYLTSIGMCGSYYKCRKRKLRWKNKKTPFRIQFNGLKNLILFREKIGFINPKHQLKFDNFIKYSNIYNKRIEDLPMNRHKFVRFNVSKEYFNNGSSGI